jgi:hypothetical protein
MNGKRLGAVLAVVAGLGLSGPGHAAPILYAGELSGPAEAPPNASPGTGFARAVLDVDADTLAIEVVFSGLLGTVTTAHIHCCTAVPLTGAIGVATQTPTFVGFPAGVTAGSYSHLFDTSLASTFNAAFVTANGGTPAGAEAALAAGLESGRAYFNIHSTLFGGGEIRGFLQRVPEPATVALLGLGLVLLGCSRAKRRSK